ncbi:MAG: HIT family protein [Nanoarchaeota archaeon]
MTCNFCRIAKHVKPEHIVYEDKAAVAFLSVEQLSKAHVLVIPKKHIRDIFDIDEKTAAHLMRITVRVAKAVKRTVRPAGINIYQCSGKAADQEVMHFHLHIFPRFKGDNLFNIYNNHHPKFRRSSYLEAIAERIRRSL